MSVGLVKRVLTTKGRRFCPVVISGNGRVSPDKVVVNGAEMRHPAGTYYIEWWEGASRKRQAVGKDASQAQAQRLRKQTQLDAKERGLELKGDGSSKLHTSLSDACSLYLEDTLLAKKSKTWAAYKVALGYFQESCTKKNLEEIDRRDLLKFAAFLREKKKLSPRTVFNKFELVVIFLRSQNIKGLVQKQDRPKYVPGVPEIFEQEDLDQLFSVCDSDERLLFDFLLMAGCREQEAVYLTWADLDFTNYTVSVRRKASYDWTPKNYRGRDIPVPDKLMDALKAAREQAPKNCPLVFSTRTCKPQKKMLEILKNAAMRAGMDPSTVWLHKFRATFATRHLRAGVDLVTLQDWMGHKDLKSTMRYLKPNRGQAVRDKVNQTFG